MLRTQVGIVGGGPAGLMLSHLLNLEGLESIVLEQRSRAYVTHRVRAGVLEQGTVDLLLSAGLGERLRREGLIHEGIELRYERRRLRIPLRELTGGRAITIYGQQKVVEDLLAARLQAGGLLYFDVRNVDVAHIETAPRIRFTHGDEPLELKCDFVAGCDGSHGICRALLPKGSVRLYEREYPFAWLGILATVTPSTEELIYASHDRGFALHSMRSPELSRLYLQCATGETADDWPDDRAWSELHRRFETDDGWMLQEGPIIDKGVTTMRSVVVEPMQYGRLFLAGDAAHIVPPTGAKGLNLALADVRTLAAALVERYRTGSTAALDAYSAARLARVWQVQHFSSWMTTLLHSHADDPGGFQRRFQSAELSYLAGSRAAQTALAERYVGLASA
jgi:p-hydroxybenzoate 3-monooxygenase